MTGTSNSIAIVATIVARVEKSEKPAASGENPEWFREPTAREHRMGGWLFTGFGVFFVLLFFVERSWGFSWVILGLGVISLIRGAYHWVRAGRGRSGDRAHSIRFTPGQGSRPCVRVPAPSGETRRTRRAGEKRRAHSGPQR